MKVSTRESARIAVILRFRDITFPYREVASHRVRVCLPLGVPLCEQFSTRMDPWKLKVKEVLTEGRLAEQVRHSARHRGIYSQVKCGKPERISQKME